MPARKYSDKEVGQILSKVASIQANAAGFATSQGTTLEDLKRVAGEVGMDPEMIERAAADLDHSRVIMPGDNFSFLLEQSVAGELSDDVWDALVTAVRGFTGSAGKLKQAHEWVGGSDTARVMLSGKGRQGRVHLKLLGDVSGISALTIVFGLVVGIFATLTPVIVAAKQSSPPSHWVTFLLCILAASLCVAGTTGILRTLRGRLKSRLNGLMDKLVEISESEQEERSMGELHSDILLMPPTPIESALNQEAAG